MNKRFYLLAAALTLLYGSTAGAQQYPRVDKVADKSLQKYHSSSCEQLHQEKAQKEQAPKKEPSPAEQKAIQMLHQDPQMRAAFINKIAAPIANKMFECGMI